MTDVLENYDLAFRRYSVVGNDSSFKAYTRDYSYTVSNNFNNRSLDDSELTVTLKDLNQDKIKDKEDDNQREQYRVIHSDPMFIVHFSGHTKSKGKAERSLSDFRKVIEALRKLYPACFIPDIPKQAASIDLPQSIFDFRKTPMECAQVESFTQKLKKIPFLIECDTVSMFMDPRISQQQFENKL